MMAELDNGVEFMVKNGNGKEQSGCGPHDSRPESYPASEKIYVKEGEFSVPRREISLSGGEPSFQVYDTSGPQGYNVHEALPKLRAPWIEKRRKAG